jgi:uncharacterized membrane protein
MRELISNRNTLVHNVIEVQIWQEDVGAGDRLGANCKSYVSSSLVQAQAGHLRSWLASSSFRSSETDYDGSQAECSTSRQFFVYCHTYVTVTKLNCARAWKSLNFDGFGNSLYAQFQSPTYWIGLTMIVLGVILLLIGYFTGISILYTIGGILVVVGVVLWILGAVGRPVGGRKVWF